MFKHQNVQIYGLNFNYTMSNFRSLEFVVRGSEAQLQVGEKLNYVT